MRPCRIMTYSTTTVEAINKGPKNLGNQLGRAAVSIHFSAVRIAELTGATRQTVYNWMRGGEVLLPYRANVERLIAILENSTTADSAWEKACKTFNRKT